MTVLMRKMFVHCLLAWAASSALAVSNAQVFAYAAGNFPSLFSGPATAGQYLQFDYRYYAASGNAVAVDTSGVIFLLGPVSGNVLTSVGPASAYADIIGAWAATQVGGTQMGGSRQGLALNIAASGAVVTTLAGAGTAGAVDGIGASAKFDFPTGLTTDGQNLYVADTLNNKIRKVVIATGVVSTLAGSGTPSSVDGTGLAASFYGPVGITTDGSDLFVTDQTSRKIRRISIASGAVTTLAGSGANASTDGSGLAASFRSPAGITTDGTYLYVADIVANKIRKIAIATAAVSTLAGSGTSGAADGIGIAATFANPNGITTDGSNLYVVDSGNNKIRTVVIASASVTTLAGSGSPGAADGPGGNASFNVPASICSEGVNLYVGDSGNQKIRKIAIATGQVSTLAGSGSAGTADGKGTAATFKYPDSITTDGVSLYVADRIGDKLRKLQ